MLMQLIMSLTQSETDPSKKVEYADWNEVNIFIKIFKNNLKLIKMVLFSKILSIKMQSIL